MFIYQIYVQRHVLCFFVLRYFVTVFRCGSTVRPWGLRFGSRSPYPDLQVKLPEAFQQLGSRIPATEHRAMKLSQLQSLGSLLHSILEAVDLDRNGSKICFEPTSERKQEVALDMYAIDAHCVKPFTLAFRCSFVELLALGKQTPRCFVSHYWGSLISKETLDPGPLNPRLHSSTPRPRLCDPTGRIPSPEASMPPSLPPPQTLRQPLRADAAADRLSCQIPRLDRRSMWLPQGLSGSGRVGSLGGGSGAGYWICTFANNQHELGELSGGLEAQSRKQSV